MTRLISVFQQKKLDSNHNAIAQGLVADGCLDMSLHELGRGRPDLLIATPAPAPGVARILILFEIKSEHHHRSRHKQTLERQQHLIDLGWPIHRVLTLQEARAIVERTLRNGPSELGPRSEPTLTGRLFSQDATYGVALTTLPMGPTADEDALLAILYGFSTLLKDTQVTSLMLNRGAKKSGIRAPRLDRILSRHAAHVISSGTGNGRRYSLSISGRAKALDIVNVLAGTL